MIICFRKKERPLLKTEAFRNRVREGGDGYQTTIYEALKQYPATNGNPLDETVIRLVIRG